MEDRESREVLCVLGWLFSHTRNLFANIKYDCIPVRKGGLMTLN